MLADRVCEEREENTNAQSKCELPTDGAGTREMIE